VGHGPRPARPMVRQHARRAQRRLYSVMAHEECEHGMEGSA
jgi:hypothetical protein